PSAERRGDRLERPVVSSERSRGDAEHPPPRGDEVVLARPVLVEHPSCGMRNEAVELDRDALFRPREMQVARASADADSVVDAWRRKLETADDPEHARLPAIGGAHRFGMSFLEQPQDYRTT